MSEVSQNNRRILKNTLMLYFRMFVVMGVMLYTSRVLISVLGLVDYGIYNVIGGVVTMLSVLNGVMSAGTSRYMNIALGKDDLELARKTFNVCFVLYFILCLTIFLLAETIGLWFLNTQLVIPEDRIIAANWVYQFTIFSMMALFMSNPFDSTIIAHEKMNVYAYISVIEVCLKLGIVYFLLLVSQDRLIFYGLFVMISDIMIRSLYVIYCRRNFRECSFSLYKDKSFYIEVMSYSGWNLFGSIAALVKGQGLNILLNVFFNPAVNASRAIAYQVDAAVYKFTDNFLVAVKPQIIKYYAANDIKNMSLLILRSSKMSFFLLFFFSLPICIETPYIINVWLQQIPEHVVSFVRVVIAISAVEGIANPLMTAAHATGNIALYQSLVGSITILNIPISFVFLKLGYPPITVFVISFIIAVICLFVRLWIVRRLIKEFPAMRFFKNVIVKCLLICCASSVIPIFLYISLDTNFLSCILVILSCWITSGICIYFVGLSEREKDLLRGFVNSKINKVYENNNCNCL